MQNPSSLSSSLKPQSFSFLPTSSMAINALTLARATHPFLSRVINISRRNAISHSSIVPTPFKRASSHFSLLQQCSFTKATQKGAIFSEIGLPKTSFGKIGLAGSRVSAAGGGGSGGKSGDGNSGGGGGGQGGGDGKGNGGKNWSLLAWYLKMLEMYPVLTKAVTSAFLTLFGDVVCQLVIDQAPSLDLKRTFLFTFLGLVLVGPTLHFWYLYLSKLVTLPGASGALLRLVLDQFVFSPIFIGVFLATLVTLEGRPSEVLPKLEQEWFSAVLANWQLWIPFQFLNFRFVPQQFQVLAANVVALVWNVILSFKAHKEIIPK